MFFLRKGDTNLVVSIYLDIVQVVDQD